MQEKLCIESPHFVGTARGVMHLINSLNLVGGLNVSSSDTLTNKDLKGLFANKNIIDFFPGEY